MSGKCGNKIPKVIHYCWFGRKPLPEAAIKCINSWKKFCPDYEIIEWNEDNFDLASCAYVMEAYAEKKWAFVSDYARFKILHRFGGIYFDTDVELLKSIEPIILQGSFMGFEHSGGKWNVNPGLGMGMEKGNPICAEIIKDYEQDHFVRNGRLNQTTIVERITSKLLEYGLHTDNCIQTIQSIHIYPTDFFSPLDYDTNVLTVTPNSYTIHWYDSSWFDKTMQLRRENSLKIKRIVKGPVGEYLCQKYLQLSYYWEWIATGQTDILKEKIKERMTFLKRQ